MTVAGNGSGHFLLQRLGREAGSGIVGEGPAPPVPSIITAMFTALICITTTTVIANQCAHWCGNLLNRGKLNDYELKRFENPVDSHASMYTS